MAADIATRELRQPIDVGEYLFRRLREVGIRAVHGVPGEKERNPTYLMIEQRHC